MVEVRDATPADARAIATMLVRSWRAAYRGLIPDHVLDGLSAADREQAWSDTLTAPQPRTCAVVATVDGAVVGVGMTGPPLVADDRVDPTLGDVYALYLDPDVWHRGYGALVHAAALDRLRSCGFTHAGLWVLDGNERALRFYTRHGWTDTGRTQVDQGPGGIELCEHRLVRGLTDESAVRVESRSL